jgi:hypothetical protein
MLLVDAAILRIVRYFLVLLRLNPRLMENAYWYLPVLDDGHGNCVQVGHDPSTVRSYCGDFRRWKVCREKDLHSGIVLNGVDFTGMSAVSASHLWCKNWLCPRCFTHGACVVGSRRIEDRLAAFVEQGFGRVEHVVFSVPKVCQDLPLEVLFKRLLAVAKDRAVSGVAIFHGRYIDKELGGLAWRAHFHVLGFVHGGFDQCRTCVHDRDACARCDGFKGREVRGFANDGWIVKVAQERLSVFGTAWYQLNHHTVKLGIRRVHSVRWFGKCGNRMLKSDYHRSGGGCLCPVCRAADHESIMDDGGYKGKRLPLDASDPCYRSVYAVPDLDKKGLPNFLDVDGGDSNG